jgi:thiol-disulfide isomerase/thioredoxin
MDALVGPVMTNITRYAFCLCLVASGLVVAAEDAGPHSGPDRTVTLATGFDLQVQRFPAEGRDLLIWLPSKYGIRDGHTLFANAIQDRGINFWLVDLHESYMAPTGSRAYAEFEPAHVKQLIDHAVQQGWRRIFLGGESRGGALAMRAAREWQMENPAQPALRGMVFYHPNLVEGYTAIGREASLHPVTQLTNLPVYIFQPQFNTKFLHSAELLERLQSGGSPAYLHYLEGVRGGFHVRDTDMLSASEAAERARVGERVHEALRLLADIPPPSQAVDSTGIASPSSTRPVDRDDTLAPVMLSATPPLRLPDGDGRTVALNDIDDEVILVNFWASWCGPCVEEIASLVRLTEHFRNKPFRVLAINIGESPSHISDFFKSLGITPNFEVLYDESGDIAKAWRVYAVPSTYLLDKGQSVRFGYRGALEWDRPDVIDTVQALIE